MGTAFDHYTGPKTLDQLLEYFEGWKDKRQLKQMYKYTLNDNRGDEGYAIYEMYMNLNGTDVLCLKPRCGLMDRDGRIYGCGYAQHDTLARIMGWDIADLECKGWIRFDAHQSSRAVCYQNPSQEQLNKISQLGLSDVLRIRELP